MELTHITTKGGTWHSPPGVSASTPVPIKPTEAKHFVRSYKEQRMGFLNVDSGGGGGEKCSHCASSY